MTAAYPTKFHSTSYFCLPFKNTCATGRSHSVASDFDLWASVFLSLWVED